MIYPLLCQAIFKNDQEEINRLLNIEEVKNLDFSFLSQTGESGTVLMIASEQGTTDTVKTLLAMQITPEKRLELLKQMDKNGNTALILASCSNHTEIVIVLLAAEHLTPKDTLELLTQTDHDGNTALIYAAFSGFTETVIALLASEYLMLKDKLELLTQTDKDRNTALMLASSNGHTKIVQVLLAGIKTENQLELLKQTNKCGYTALMAASSSGEMDTVKAILVIKGLTSKNRLELLEQTNEEGYTAQMWALFFNHTETAELIGQEITKARFLLKDSSDNDDMTLLPSKGTVAEPNLSKIGEIYVAPTGVAFVKQVYKSGMTVQMPAPKEDYSEEPKTLWQKFSSFFSNLANKIWVFVLRVFSKLFPRAKNEKPVANDELISAGMSAPSPVDTANITTASPLAELPKQNAQQQGRGLLSNIAKTDQNRAKPHLIK